MLTPWINSLVLHLQAPISHMCTGSSVGCSTSHLVPCLWLREGRGKWLKILGSWICIGNLNQISGSWHWIRSAPLLTEWTSRWIISLSFCLSFSLWTCFSHRNKLNNIAGVCACIFFEFEKCTCFSNDISVLCNLYVRLIISSWLRKIKYMAEGNFGICHLFATKLLHVTTWLNHNILKNFLYDDSSSTKFSVHANLQCICFALIFV